MEDNKCFKFIVSADFHGNILTNSKKSFWWPINRGQLYFSANRIHYRILSSDQDFLELDFSNIIKVKMLSLDPRKNRWNSWYLGNPFYLLFWNPFWNKFLINFTYLDNEGQPRELFFRLKTKSITLQTLKILKKMLSDSVVDSVSHD